MAASWTFALVDGVGRTLTESGELSFAATPTLVRQRTGPQMLTMLVPLTSPEAKIIAGSAELNPHIKGYRTPEGGTIDNRTLEFYGSVWVDEIGQDDGGVDMLLVTAMDQLALLDKRFTDAQFPPTDLGLLLKAMVDTTNSVDGETGIATDAGWITPSSTIDLDLRTNLPSILSMVSQFSQQLDGIETWLAPTELAGGKFSELHCAPRRGGDKTNVVFGYGSGTAGNCNGLGRVRDKNLVENDARGYSDTLASQRTNPASIASLGRLIGYTSFTGETDQAVMNARTQGRLEDRSTRQKVAAYTARVAPDAPTLFDDFDVGDTVTLHYRKGVEWLATPRVDTATIVVDRGGYERLESVTFRSITT